MDNYKIIKEISCESLEDAGACIGDHRAFCREAMKEGYEYDERIPMGDVEKILKNAGIYESGLLWLVVNGFVEKVETEKMCGAGDLLLVGETAELKIIKHPDKYGYGFLAHSTGAVWNIDGGRVFKLPISYSELRGRAFETLTLVEKK